MFTSKALARHNFAKIGWFLGACSFLFASLNTGYAESSPSVVQNRFYRKALRPELSLAGGMLLNEAYSKTSGAAARVGLYFNEYVGLEVNYSKFVSTNSPDLDALSRLVYYKEDGTTTHVVPSFVRLSNATFAQVAFAPIYGKINILNYAIAYSDLTISAGTGVLKTSSQSEIPMIFGVGQRFYFTKNMSARFDATDYIFSETRENNGARVESLRHAWFVSFGVGFFLWAEES